MFEILGAMNRFKVANNSQTVIILKRVAKIFMLKTTKTTRSFIIYGNAVLAIYFTVSVCFASQHACY